VSDAGAWKRADARHHDREAERYDGLIGREFAPYQATHTAEPWARRLAAAGVRHVLDVGGGTGRTALPVARAGARVVVLDTSRGMLRVARRKAALAGLDGLVTVVVGDAERMPFRCCSFDAVVCQGVLHHLPDVGRALAEVDRVLLPGGRLFLAEPDAAGSLVSRFVRRCAGAARPALRPILGRSSPAADHERPLRAAALVAELSARGYALRTAHLVHPPYVYRFLPAAVGRAAAAALNRGAARRRSGDIVVIEGLKPGPRAHDGAPEAAARIGARG
jgi:SAM-dependent methyltransferase